MEKEPTSQADKKPINKLYIKILVLVMAFAAPYLFTYQRAEKPWRPGSLEANAPVPTKYAQEARNEALRSGSVGLGIAILIMLMYSLDKNVLAQSSKKKKEIKDIKVTVIMAFFAFLLWISWTCVSHIMLTAHDEINDVPAQLPGLDSI
ncbi:MAG: hypothetical protein IPG59_19860 [Candidatus Melainabacteria bacterium]|nr:MAG: hypothetical protein IPG59_19860 [Candidatus Melainabacteria bacterium]